MQELRALLMLLGFGVIMVGFIATIYDLLNFYLRARAKDKLINAENPFQK